MADRTLAIAFPPAGAVVSIHIATNPDRFAVAKDDNGDGYVPQQVDDALGDSTISITADGYKPYAVHFKFRNVRDNANEPRPLNQQVNVGQDIPALVPMGPPMPAPGALPSLIASGRDFVNPDGSRVVLKGTDEFLAFRYYLSGADLTPFYAESRELGFDTWRVHFQGSKAQNTIFDLSPNEPGFYEHVRPFLLQANSQGIVILGNLGVDNQDVQSPPSHWSRMYQEGLGLGVIWSKANEWRKNIQPLTPADLPNPPGGVLWSQGSGLQDEAPFRPTGNVMEFHPVRTYTTTMRDAVASAIELFEVQNYGNVRLLYDEPGRMGTQNPSPAEFADPKHCREYAQISSALCAGVVFHNWPGQSGRLMDEGTKACAREFVRGIHA